MPVAQLTNIAGADGEGFSTGPQIQDVLNGTTAIPFGTLVALATPITTTTTTTFVVNTATSVATTAPLNIGIAIGGGPNTGTGSSILASGTGQVVIQGHVRALVDQTTTPTVAGHRLVIGTVTAGCLGDLGGTTASAGLDYGVVLEALATTTTGTLVNIWFEKT